MSLTKATYSMILGASANVLDFGAVGDGITDDTAAIQAAVNNIAAQGGGTVYFPDPATSYRITSPITLDNYVSLQGDGRYTRILRDFVNGFAFIAINKTYIAVRNLFITSTTPSVTSPSGGIGLQGSTYCSVNSVVVTGMRQYGVWLFDTSNTVVQNCSFSGWIGAYQQDSCDIGVINDSNWNIIESNWCYGGGDHGVLVQDPYSGSEPTGNQVIGNTIGAHTAYGIAVYATTYYNSKTKILNNEVRDITGTSLSGASGAGIYIQSMGGTICSNNTVSNCCIDTTNFFTLAPGAIGVTAPTGTLWNPIIISNNSLTSVRGPCISAITNGGPVTIDNNVCTLDAADATSNPASIYVSNSFRCTISNNVTNHTSDSPAIHVIARDGVTVTNTAVISNSVRASELGIIVERIDTATFDGLRLIGNYVEGASTNAVRVVRATTSVISGNIVSGATSVFELNNSPKARIEGNAFSSADTTNPTIFFVGTNTSSVFSETNTYNGRLTNDASSGVIISQYANTAPPTGNSWNVGDRVIQSVPIVGQPKGWRCTVAGNPGTWVSEGNL